METLTRTLGENMEAGAPFVFSLNFPAFVFGAVKPEAIRKPVLSREVGEPWELHQWLPSDSLI
jgi:hypothetical protein